MMKGERQVSESLKGIDRSHIARYQFATKFISKNDKVLDFGCGVGYGSFILAKKGCEVTALDKDLEAILYAKNHYDLQNIEYRHSEIVQETGFFDFATCFEVLEHVEEVDEVLYEIFKSLKWDGKALFSTPDERMMPYQKEKFPFHVRHYRQNDFLDILENAGFKVRKKYTQYRKHEPAILPGWGGAYNIALCTV